MAEASKSPEVVIVGGGPAGMLLAYLLVTNGVRVRVLERHPDFRREFRGELIQPVVLEPLEQLGIMKLLVERGLARTEIERRLFVGPKRRVMVPGGNERGALISQAGLLELLHELCSRHPNYRMDFGTAALHAVRENGRVLAMTVRQGDAESRVDGDLFIVCNGRSSPLRKDAGAEVEQFSVPADTLWLRFDFSDAADVRPKGVDVHMFGRGVVTVLFPTTQSRLQIAYSAPGDLSALRKDIPELKRRLLPTLSEPIRSLVEKKLDADTESQVLKVAVDRLKSWHQPGLLFLGDAAHTMSPAGGQGLNLAMRDSIVAANHLVRALREGRPIDDAVLAAIEAERRPEIETIQAAQTRISRMVMVPLAVEHVMFTMLGVAMRLFMKPGRGPASPRVGVDFPVIAGS